MTNLDGHGRATLFVGAETITQGNPDIWSNQLGALAELVLVPSRLSLMGCGGYEASSFDIGPDRGGPYFRVGLYKRF